MYQTLGAGLISLTELAVGSECPPLRSLVEQKWRTKVDDTAPWNFSWDRICN